MIGFGLSADVILYCKTQLGSCVRVQFVFCCYPHYYHITVLFWQRILSNGSFTGQESVLCQCDKPWCVESSHWNHTTYRVWIPEGAYCNKLCDISGLHDFLGHLGWPCLTGLGSPRTFLLGQLKCHSQWYGSPWKSQPIKNHWAKDIHYTDSNTKWWWQIFNISWLIIHFEDILTSSLENAQWCFICIEWEWIDEDDKDLINFLGI